MNQIYFIQIEDTGLIKIGVTGDLIGRLQSFKTLFPQKFKLLLTIKGNIKQEQQIHLKFKSLRQHGEWFYPDDQLLNFISSLRIKSLKCEEDLNYYLSNDFNPDSDLEISNESSGNGVKNGIQSKVRFLKLTQISDILQIAPNRIRNWIKQNSNPPPWIIIDGAIRFPEDKLAEWIKQFETPTELPDKVRWE